jgi:two-component system, NarL family, invasion response regulator UvrY
MTSRKILIVDDHFAIRSGIKHILISCFGNMEFGEATNAAELFELLGQQKWDILILDINLPGKNGLDILKEIRGQELQIPILVFSMYSEEQMAIRALKAGASGYLCKDSGDQDLVKAIEQLLFQKKYVSPTVAGLLATQIGDSGESDPHQLLSDREYQTLLLIASGKPVSQIAKELNLSVQTISTYRARILEKMGLKNNAELTHYVIRQKLL